MPQEEEEQNQEQQGPISELTASSLELSRVTRPEKAADEANFERTRYQLTDDVSLVFRGREELPRIAEAEDTVVGVLTLDERPVHTSGDDYGRWVSDVTHGQEEEDVFTRAADEDANHIEVIATSTPLGIVDAAIKMGELGIGSTEPEVLKQLRDTLAEHRTTDAVIELYDQLLAAALIAEGVPDLRSERDPNPDAPVEVALALAGEPTAIKLLEAKRAVLANLDRLRSERSKLVEYKRGEDEPDFREPGERLSEEELNMMDEAGLVAVHTSPVSPFSMGERGESPGLIRPTAEFNQDKPDAFPRGTMHFSLNHAVESHIMGNFDARPYTIVSRLSGLARLNGAPAVLDGVDTYFSINPGEGLFVPPDAEVIATSERTDGNFVEQTGNLISLRGGPIGAEELRQFIQFAAERLNNEDKRYADATVLNGLEYTGAFGALPYERSLFEEPDQFDDTPERQAWLEQARQWKSLITEVTGDENAFRHLDSFSRVLRESLQACTENPKLLEKYPLTTPLLLEAMRRLLVNQAIVRAGGKVVHSDGMSAYIQEKDFQDAENKVSHGLGLRAGLHDSQPEGWFEQRYSKAVGGATDTVRDPETGKPLRADYHWEKFENRGIWTSLYGVPWPTRRQAVATGMLTFDQKLPDPESSHGLF